MNNPDSIIAITLLIVITASIIIFEMCRKKDLIVDTLSIFNLYFIVFYILPPIYFLLINTEHINHWLISGFNLTRISFYVLFAYISFIFGWKMFRTKATIIKPRRLRNPKSLINICFISAILYGIAFFLFVQAYGGLKEALIFGVQIRYGLEDRELGITSMASRFLPIGSLLLLVCYIKIFLEREISNRTQWYIIMAFVGILFVFTSLIFAGRGNIIYTLLFMFLCNLNYHKKIKKLGIVLFLVAFSLIILYGKQVLYSISVGLQSGIYQGVDAFHYLHDIRVTRTDETIVSAFFQETFHTIHSIEVAAIEAGKSVPYNFFSDYLWCLTRIIPQRILMTITTPPPTISTINTYLIKNIFISSVPPGIIASFIYAAGISGLLLGMLIYGAIGAMIERTLYEWQRSSKVFMAFYIVLSFIYVGYAVNGDPHGLIYIILLFMFVFMFLWPFLTKYNTPQKLDRATRCM